MSPGEFTITLVLCLIGAVQLSAAASQKRTATSIRDVLGRIADVGAAMLEQAGNAQGTDGAKIAELEHKLSTLARDLNDVDERAEARFRRLTARERRENATDDDSPGARHPFPLTAPPAATGTNGAPARPRRLIPRR